MYVSKSGCETKKEKSDFFGSQTVYLREQDLRKVK